MNQQAALTVEHITLSATRQDTEPHRINRLHRTLGYALALAEVDRNARTFGKLAGLDDHKGDLTVIWSYPPTEKEKSYFDRAWRNDRVGDGGTPAEHVLE